MLTQVRSRREGSERGREELREDGGVKGKWKGREEETRKSERGWKRKTDGTNCERESKRGNSRWRDRKR